MTLTFSRRTIFFVVAAWCTVIAMTADAFNLDDLIPGTMVLHAREDAAGIQDSFSTASVSHTGQHAAVRDSKDRVSLNGHDGKIIFDEDSPSLACDDLAEHAGSVVIAPDDHPAPFQEYSSSEPLHLLFRTLLI